MALFKMQTLYGRELGRAVCDESTMTSQSTEAAPQQNIWLAPDRESKILGKNKTAQPITALFKFLSDDATKLLR